MTRWTAPLVLLSILLLAACGNGDDGGDVGLTTSPTETPAPSVLRIHHIDVEQGDAVLIVSPAGETAMVDNGGMDRCANVLSYLGTLGITRIDYHFASHYHADHIGCLDDMAAAGITVAAACYDRGGSYDSNVFRHDYRDICGAKRQTASKGQVVTLDAGAVNPVTIAVIDLDGAGVPGHDENALSLVLRLTYGSFDEVLAGDLTGAAPYPLVESAVAPRVGDVEVYKVNHHGSKYSSSDAWLNAVKPEVAIISVGDNDYGHPTAEALSRLHDHGVTTYWTNLGSSTDATPVPGEDHVVDGTIVIEAEPVPGGQFTVSGGGIVDTYANR